MVTRNGKCSGPPSGWDHAHLEKLIDELDSIRRDMTDLAEECAHQLDLLHPAWCDSGRNLLHYLALRRQDIRPLQERLSMLGLSSLGRAESHVCAALSALLKVLGSLTGRPSQPTADSMVGYARGRQLLDQHTDQLLGHQPGARRTRIMVTMPSEAADDYLLVRELLDSGMNCMRINCAHDSEDAWERMIENLRRAKRELGKTCRVLMDLGGPKLRTGPIEPGPAVIKWRPLRDDYGKEVEPARIWLRPAGNPDAPDVPADAIIDLDGIWLSSLCVNDSIAFNDARGGSRTIKIVSRTGHCWWGESHNTSYVIPGTTMHRICNTRQKNSGKKASSTTVGQFSGMPAPLFLHKGDTLILTRDLVPGKSAVYDQQGRLISPATIGCTLPEVFGSVRQGERIFFDDGKIGGIIRGVSADRIKVEIITARPKGERLGAEKGINLPDSRLRLDALTEKDRNDLRFVVHHSHMVGMSFVQEVSDVQALRHELNALGADNLGIILKIETRRGFEMLPDLILAAMSSQSAGVMIARGDLAVECGYERLAEIQEEILWLCEAAHIPVIWATQVLESLAKSGIPSRAEITDAAMGERAECVMLNKGPHMADAVRVLDNILQRMGAHQNKKISLLRQLRWWERTQSHRTTVREET